MDIIASRLADGFLFKFIVKPSFENAEGLQNIDTYGKDIKKNLFANTPFQFEVLNEKLDSIKTFNY